MPVPTTGGNPKPTGATAKPGLKKADSNGQKTEQEIKDEKKDKKEKPLDKKEEKSEVTIEDKKDLHQKLV